MTSNQSDLALEFNIGHCNGTMKLEIFVNDQPVAEYADIDSNLLFFKQRIDWPATVKLIVSNKNLMFDTTIDSNGKITADKFIELRKIQVDNVDLGIEYMKSIVLDTGKDKINSFYWGFNGTVNLVFDHCNSFMWHLVQRVKHDGAYVITQEKF